MSVYAESLKSFIRKNLSKYAQTSRSYVFDCPQCNGRRKLYIDKKNGRYICFKCKEMNNYSGDAAYALADLTNLPVSSIKSELNNDLVDGSPILDISIFPVEEEAEITEINIVEWPSHFTAIEDPRSIEGLKYLNARGVPLEVSLKYDIKYDSVEKRVCFPVYDGKDLCGWQGRLIYDHPKIPKAKTSHSLNKSHMLMFSNLIDKNDDFVIVCEGPFDAIKCGKNAICTMGKSISNHQIKKILDLKVRNVYLGLDRDAYLEIQALAKKLYGKTNLKIMEPLEGKDFGAMTFEECKKAKQDSKNLDTNSIFVHLK